MYALPSCGRETYKYPDESYIVKTAIVDINGVYDDCISLCLSGVLFAGLHGSSFFTPAPIMKFPLALNFPNFHLMGSKCISISDITCFCHKVLLP